MTVSFSQPEKVTIKRVVDRDNYFQEHQNIGLIL